MKHRSDSWRAKSRYQRIKPNGEKASPIPVNTMVEEAGAGITIENITIADLYTEDTVTANGFEVSFSY